MDPSNPNWGRVPNHFSATYTYATPEHLHLDDRVRQIERVRATAYTEEKLSKCSHQSVVDIAGFRLHDIDVLLAVVRQQREWLNRLQARVTQDDKGVIVHECPPEGSAVMPCCGRTPLEVMSDRITRKSEYVNCDRVRLRESVRAFEEADTRPMAKVDPEPAGAAQDGAG